MLGEQSFQPYAINTFSHRGKNFEEITPIHYVRPHEVRQYSRRDGTLVASYFLKGRLFMVAIRCLGGWQEM